MYLIDFLDGNLSGEEEIEMLSFLEKNPDIREEFNGLEKTKLSPGPVNYKAKEKLKHAELNRPQQITTDNYEEYFIKSVENELDRTEKKELLMFLQLNPLLSKSYDQFHRTKLVADTTVCFPDKISLKTIALQSTENISRSNYQDVLIANLEGELNEKEEKELSAFMQLNPLLFDELYLFEKTKLKADISIVFANKKQLKQTVVVPVRFIHRKHAWYAVAASIVVLLMAGWLFRQPSPVPDEGNRLAIRDQWNREMISIPQVEKQMPDTKVKIAKASNSDELTVPVLTKINPLASVDEDRIAEVLSDVESKPLALFEVEQPEMTLIKIYHAPLFQQNGQNASADEIPMEFIGGSQPVLANAYGKIKEVLSFGKKAGAENIGLWDIAQAGVEGYNKLTENDYQLERFGKDRLKN